MNWKNLQARKSRVDDLVEQDILAHWRNMTQGHEPPETLQRLLPSNLAFYLIYEMEVEETLEKHPNIEEMLTMDHEENCVLGTMDASVDPGYEYLYRQYGWRTVIYWFVSIHHPSIPGIQDQKSMILRVPGMFVSEAPSALDEDGFERAVFLVNLTLSAMLLRIGLTLFSTRSDRLWKSIPGALFLLSPDTIYQMNAAAEHWFGAIPEGHRSIDIAACLPDNLASWVRDVIGTDGTYSETRGSRRLWLNLRDGRRILVQAGLRPLRLWDHVQTTSRMATGFDGVEMDQVRQRIHLLLLRDVTREWEAEVLQKEIDLARRMQNQLLPTELPASEIFDIAARCRPASHIGGDLYDVIQLDTGQIAMIIGDAAGHGVDSALLAALVSGAFRASIQQHTAPEDILRVIDRVLRTTSQPGFVTLIYLLLDPNELQIDYGLAGHYPPVVCRSDTEKCTWFAAASLPLGVHLPAHYDIGTFKIGHGDIVAAFSDGLLEYRNESGNPYQETLDSVIVAHRNSAAKEILDAIFQTASDASSIEKQQDDMTGIVVRIC